MRKAFVKQFPGDWEVNVEQWLQGIFNNHPDSNIQVMCDLAAVDRQGNVDTYVWYTVIVSD